MHPEDPACFAQAVHPLLRSAVADLSWLQERGYAFDASLKLVGDRYALKQRQRAAVARCACAQSTVNERAARMVTAPELRGERVAIDGFNVLTTLEVALSGGVVLIGRDGAMRDIAGVHGSYRRVEETIPALAELAAFLQACEVAHCMFLLDRPVSNSGRLRALIEQHAIADGWPFEARVVLNPDAELARSSDVVASADGAILDACARWFNLAHACVAARISTAYVVDLSVGD